VELKDIKTLKELQKFWKEEISVQYPTYAAFHAHPYFFIMMEEALEIIPFLQSALTDFGMLKSDPTIKVETQSYIKTEGLNISFDLDKLILRVVYLRDFYPAQTFSGNLFIETSNSAKLVSLYRVWCCVDKTYENIWSENAPTQCPRSVDHEIDHVRTYLVDTLGEDEIHHQAFRQLDVTAQDILFGTLDNGIHKLERILKFYFKKIDKLLV